MDTPTKFATAEHWLRVTTGVRRYRLATLALLLITVSAAILAVGDARPAAAQGEASAGRYLVINVPAQVIDDLIATQRGTAGPGWPIPPELKLTYKFCATDGCICNDFFGYPDECAADSAPPGGERVSLASSLGTRAILDQAARELKSGKYSTIKLCSTFQQLHEGCTIVSPR